MVTLLRTDSNHPFFNQLIVELDDELRERNEQDNDFFARYNHLDAISNVVLVCEGGIPIGCGAFKSYSNEIAEIKRMYVAQEHRGKGYADKVLGELENWASQCGYSKLILETGIKMPEAISLYSKNGYVRIPNYGQYAGIMNSVCFEKKLVGENKSALSV